LQGMRVKENTEKEEMVKEEEGSFLTDRPRLWTMTGVEENELMWKEMRIEQAQEGTEEEEEALEVEVRDRTGHLEMRWRGWTV